MSNDNVLEEFAEVDRKLWEEGGGTIDGFFELCHRIAQEDIAKSGMEPVRRTEAEAWSPDRAGVPDYAGAMCVKEGEGPEYGEGTSDLAREGAEGDAE